MSTEIEVALVGRDIREFLPRGPGSYERSFFDEDENTRPWDDRLRVTLSVEDHETLERIFDRAVEGAGSRRPTGQSTGGRSTTARPGTSPSGTTTPRSRSLSA